MAWTEARVLRPAPPLLQPRPKRARTPDAPIAPQPWGTTCPRRLSAVLRHSRQAQERCLRPSGRKWDAVCTHLSPLQKHKVRPQTQRAYFEVLVRLSRWMGATTLPAWSAAEWDGVLVEQLELLHDRGESVKRWRKDVGRSFVGAATPSGAAPPGVPRGNAGSGRMEGVESRNVPAASTAHEGLPLEALGLFVMFEAYLRPAELARVRASDIVAGQPAGGMAFTPVSIVLHPEEGLLPSKTGEFDATVMFDLDRHRWVGDLVCRLATGLPPGVKIWPMGYAGMQRALQRAVKGLHLPKLGMTLHCFGHGGASHDRLVLARDLAAVQRRGQWRSFSSVRRYDKSGRGGLQLQTVPRVKLKLLEARAHGLRTALLLSVARRSASHASRTSGSSSKCSRARVALLRLCGAAGTQPFRST